MCAQSQVTIRERIEYDSLQLCTGGAPSPLWSLLDVIKFNLSSLLAGLLELVYAQGAFISRGGLDIDSFREELKIKLEHIKEMHRKRNCSQSWIKWTYSR